MSLSFKIGVNKADRDQNKLYETPKEQKYLKNT